MGVRGYSSLALLAAAALARRPDLTRIAAVLEAGHGEVFMQRFTADLVALDAPVSLRPEAAAALLAEPAVGSGVARLRGLADDLREALPDAADILLLPLALVDLPPSPLYGRAPDAKLPSRRADATPIEAIR